MTNIVFLCRDRYRLTKQALESLYQSTPPNAFTLTIVDDGSEDFRTVKVLEQVSNLKRNSTILSVRNSHHILSTLKNLGVYWSEQHWGRGNWLYLSDNDVYFKPDWLTYLTSLAAYSEDLNPAFAIWGGQAHPFHHSIGWVGYASRSGLPITLSEHDCLAGTSWLMRWPTWDKFGPLTGTAPGVCKGEDWAFTERLRAAGGRIGVVVPHVVLDCSITQSDGNLAPGAELKPREAGVIYE